jgi:hypothetical protein
MGMGKIGNWEIFPWEFLGIFQNRKNAKKKTFLIAPTALNALSDSTEVAGIEDKARYSLSKDSDLFLLISNAENSCFKALFTSIGVPL